MRYKKGFTLIETLIVIAIIGILAVFSVPFYYSFQTRSQLDSTLPEIVQTLRRAQSRAMDREDEKDFGVHFESDKFVLFRDAPYDPGDTYNEVFDLPASLEIYNISLSGGGSEVVFNKLKGDTENYGNVSLRIKNGDSKTILINKEGVISWAAGEGSVLLSWQQTSVSDFQAGTLFRTKITNTSGGEVILAKKGKMEVGSITTDENWVTVNLQNTYISPIVVASYYENNNSLPASVRIRNLDSSSFEVKLQHPSGSNLLSDTIYYLVVEEGVWTFPDGTKIEAHKYDTNKVSSSTNIGGSWNNYDLKNYSHTYSSAPIVMHQVMTYNDPNWITTRVSSPSRNSNPPTTSGFRISLNGAEVTNTHNTETIGWIAIDRGKTGTVGGYKYETQRTSDSVRGHDNGCYNFSFNQTYASSPYVLGFQQEMDGGDGSWTVKCNLSSTQVGFHDEEDQENDSERYHTTETLAFIAFESAFYLEEIEDNYYSSGHFISSAYDTNSPSSNYNTIAWNSAVPAVTELKFQIRTADTEENLSSATWVGSDGTNSTYYTSSGESITTDLGASGTRWVQYKAYFTSDESDTAILEDVVISYWK